MAKRIVVWVVVIMFLAGTTPIFAADEGGMVPNPNKKAYQHANEHARFKRAENVKDKETVMAEKAARKEAEMEKKELEKAKREAEEVKRQAEKEAKKKQKEMEKEARKMKKGFGR